MRPEESNALFEGYGTRGYGGGGWRRAAPLVAIGVIVGAAIVAGVWGYRERGRAVDAELSRGQAIAERDGALAAKDEAERQAAEAVEVAERLAALAADAQVAKDAAEKALADTAEARDILRGVVSIWAGGTSALPAPALHELLRGEVLARLKERLTRAEYLDLAGAVVRAMALDRRVRDGSRVRVDFDFAKEYLRDAQAAYAPDSAEMGAALRSVAEMCFAYQAIPALDEPARAALRENARTCAERAAEIERAAGGRALARSLFILGQLERTGGDAARASEFLSQARAALGDGGAAREHAEIILELARAELDVAYATNDAVRRTEVLSLLRRTADALAQAHPFGDPMELEVRSLVLSLLVSSEALPDAVDETTAMSERIALGRVLVQLGRAPLGYEVLARAARHFASDDTRFRERLEVAIWLARALDQLGSTEAALAMLDQPRLAEDARVFGTETVLVREFETTRAMLRARLKR